MKSCIIKPVIQDFFYLRLTMARIIRPTWAIRCVQSGCKTLFEVAQLEDGKQQEVVCPKCGEHYLYPPKADDSDN